MNLPELQYPWLLAALVLLPVLIAIYFVYRRKRAIAYKKLGDKNLVDMLLVGYKRNAKPIKFSLILTATSLLILALANPRLPVGGNGVQRTGIDVILTLDVSKSMLATDIQPNRLERAKQVMNKIIDGLKNDRVGIVIFAGKAYLQMPVTSDLGAAKMYLSSATPESVPTQGTVLGDAMKMSYSAFNSKDKKFKSVVIITDGEDHDENAVDIAKQMAKEGVVINTVGMGSTEGSTIPDPVTGQAKTDRNGNVVVSKLNDQLLKTISESTNGIYQPFSSTDAVVGNIQRVLASMPQRVVRDNSLANFESLAHYLFAAVLLLLLIELFISERKTFRKRMQNAKTAVAAVSILLLTLPAWAQTENEHIQQGNAAYKEGKFEEAAQHYRQALEVKPDNNTAQFNLAAALYKAKDKEGALQAYDKSIENYTKANDLAKLSQSYYNKAVVLHNDNKIDECIEDYKRALRINPNDDDARHNLQKALRKKKEQQNQDQQKKEQQNQSQPKPQQSKLKQQDAEEKLKALQQQERNLQERLRKSSTPTPNSPDKDW